ncbi:MAG: helix-turn-helix transcriptional regulator [Hafnia sp.]
MLKKLSILIVDSNSFFSDGLKKLLITHCNSKGVKLTFTSNPSDYLLADISFLSHKMSMTSGSKSPLDFKICSSLIFIHIPLFIKKSINTMSGAQCVFKRNQSCADYIMLVDNVIKKNEFQTIETLSVRRNIEMLTHREKEVMYYFSKGYSPKKTGECLKISLKTVSSHKRCVMKKLNFTRLTELHTWLLNYPVSIINDGL